MPRSYILQYRNYYRVNPYAWSYLGPFLIHNSHNQFIMTTEFLRRPGYKILGRPEYLQRTVTYLLSLMSHRCNLFSNLTRVAGKVQLELTKRRMSDELAHSSPASTAPCDAEGKNKDKNDAKRAAKMEKFLAKQAKAEQFKSSNSQAAKPKSLDLEKKISEQKQVIMEVPYGEKKDLSQPMANAYDPVAVEASWGSWWEHRGFFKPEGSGRGDDDTQEPFVIVMPPPNVTGSLHLGHAIMLAVEDALVRWYLVDFLFR